MTSWIAADPPDGWEIVRLGDRFDSWGGLTPSKANLGYWGDGLPWVSSREIKGDRVVATTYSVTQKALDETGLRVCPAGTVLIVTRSGILAHSLPVAIADVPVTINQDMKAFYSDEPFLNEWLALYLRSSASTLLQTTRREGTTVQSVQYPILKDTLIPVPPVVQRQEIIDAAVRALGMQATVTTHVLSAKRAVERLHHAVLAAACSGRLTAGWRELHPNIDGATGHVARARERRLAEVGGRYSEPTVNEHALDVELPETWTVAPLGWLLSSIKYGTSKRSEYGVNGTPVLRIPNVSDGRLRLVDLKFAAFLDRELQDLALVPGDILMIRSNGSPQLVGRSVLVNSDAQGMAYAGYLMRLRTDLQVIAPAYMTAALATLDTRRQIEMPLRSTSGVNNINTDEVRSLRIAVPPLDEQTEIVRQVDQLTELADDLIRRIDAAEHRVDLTSQAVLAKAFRGELLPYGASIVSSKADVR